MRRREPRSDVWLILGATLAGVTLALVSAKAPSEVTDEPPQADEVGRRGSGSEVGRSRQYVPGPRPSSLPVDLAVTTHFEDPSGHALDRFHAALRRAERGEGKARVLTYGASHTAADHLPGHIRRALQERFGDGGRGFTLPAWPSDLYPYWQWGATIDEGEGWERVRLGLNRGVPDYYGITGIVFDLGGRRASSRIASAESGVGERADVIEVHYQAMPGGGDFDISIDGQASVSVSTTADEVGVGRFVVDVEDGPHEVVLDTHEGAPVRLYGLVFERSGPGVVVDNVALTGSRARYHDKWLEPVYTEHLGLRQPDLILLWYGGNEGNDIREPADRTSREIRRALAKLRAAAPDASCVLLGPSDKPISEDGGWVHRRRTEAITRATRTIALGNGCAFFDTVSFMGGALSMVRWVESDPPLARGDYIHLSALGYRLLAEEIIRELLVGYE